MKLGQRIRAIREKKNVSQRQLAIKAGLSAATMSRLESGQFQSLNMESLRKIAEVLGVTVDYLVGQTTEMSIADGLVSDKTALTLFKDFDRLGEQERHILLSFANYLHHHGPGTEEHKDLHWDGKFDLERILWKVESAKRTVEKVAKTDHVRYSVQLAALKVRSEHYADLKNKLRHQAAVVIPESEVILRSKGRGDHSEPATFCLDEASVLSQAIEKAKGSAYRGIMEA